MVQADEWNGCTRICRMAGGVCSCAVALHDRAYMHRNLMAHAQGTEDVLFAHADTWINLVAMRRARPPRLSTCALRLH